MERRRQWVCDPCNDSPEQKKYFVGMGNNNALIEQILQERGFTPAESPDRVMSKKPPPPPSFQWAQDHCRIDFTLLTPRFGTKTKHMSAIFPIT